MSVLNEKKGGRRFLSALLITAIMTTPALYASGAANAPMLSNRHIYLSPKERAGLALAQRWKSHPDKPRRSEDGSVVYLFGATLPTMICTPLEVCAIKLQTGEIVQDVHAGDTARWRINPATSGQGNTATTFVVVKPTDVGLVTNLFITTDRRSYSIKLVSDRKGWIPVMSFDYPEDVIAAWDSYRQKVTHTEHAQAAHIQRSTLPHTQGLDVEHLNFNFKISGDDPSWKPLRVYSDGIKTYIQFPDHGHFNGGSPALVALGPDHFFHTADSQLVNYRVKGDRYIVDQVLNRAALITGVGSDQVRVLITRGEN